MPKIAVLNKTVAVPSLPLALVIGIMGQKFGSPTGTHESGTEEEFKWALESFQKNGFPEIKLPVTKNKNPDYKYMECYIKALPFSNKV